MLFRVFELFLVIANLSVVLAGSPPACLLACVSKEVKSSGQYTLNQQSEICANLGDEIVSCFSSTCPNNGASDAQSYFETICNTKFNSTSSSTSSSASSSSSSSSTTLSSSSVASSTESTLVVQSSSASSEGAVQTVEPTTEASATSSVAQETSSTASIIADVNSKNAAGALTSNFSAKQFVVLSIAVVVGMSLF